MKLDLDKFYNSNWKTFVHKEAMEQALKLVPEVELKDVEVENILSITFSVDEYGENPMYIEYLDKEGKKHLVRIRPAVSNEIQEILKRYVTKEEHQSDLDAVYNYFTTLNVPMEVRSQNPLDDEGSRNIILNNDNAFINFQVDPENDDAIQWLAIQNRNGSLGDQYQYFARFVDFAKVDEVPSNADFAEKLRELEEKMNVADKNVLTTSKEYTDSNITSLGDELNIKIEQTKNDLTVLIGEKAQDTLQQAKDYADIKDTDYFETSKRYADSAKQEAINESKTYTDSETNKTLIASKNYTDTKHTETMQQIEELDNKLTPDVQSLKDTQVELNISTDDLSDKLSHDIIQVFNNDDGSIQKIYFYKKDYSGFSYINFDNYRQTIIDEILEEIPDLPTNVVTTQTLDNILLQYVKKSDLDNYYTKTETDDKFALKGETGSDYDIKLDDEKVTSIKLTNDNNIIINTSNNELSSKLMSEYEQNSIYVCNNKLHLFNDDEFVTPIKFNNNSANKIEHNDNPTFIGYQITDNIGEKHQGFIPKKNLTPIVDDLVDKVSDKVEILVDNTEHPTKVNYRRDTNSVEVWQGDTGLLNGAFITDSQKNSIAEYEDKTSELGGHKISNRYWYSLDKTPNYERLVDDSDYLRTHINNPETNNETVVYTPKFKVEDKISEKNMLYSYNIDEGWNKLNGNLTIHYDGDNITKIAMRPYEPTGAEKSVVLNAGGTTIDFPSGEITFDKIHFNTDGSLTTEIDGAQQTLGKLMFTDKTSLTYEHDNIETGEIRTFAHVEGYDDSKIANRLILNAPDNTSAINCNVAPILSRTIAMPSIVECNAYCQLKTRHIANCIQNPQVTNWNMRTIEMTDETLAWKIRQPFGSFRIEGTTQFQNFASNPSGYDQSYYNGIYLRFDSSQSWGSRAHNSYTGFISFQVGSGTAGFSYRKIPCVIVEDGMSMLINVLDTSSLRGLALDAKGYSGTSGYIEITVNGSY